MNEIVKLYRNYPLRIVECDGEPWFVAQDVAKILEYSDTEHMTRRLNKDELDKIKAPVTGDLTKRFGNNDITIISEPGLYAAILGSKKREARNFQRWVTHEVIPSIRKTGAYIAPNIGMEQIKAVVQKLVETSNQLLTDNIALREKSAYMEQFIPKGIYGEPSKINGQARWQMRRGCYVSRNGTAPKRMNPDVCGYLQPDLFQDAMPATIIAKTVNIVLDKTPNLLPEGAC